MSELEKKRETPADLQREQNKRTEAVDGKSDKKDQVDESLGETAMAWDVGVDRFVQRASVSIRDLSMAMSHSEFRSLLVLYRQLTPMGRRTIGTRLQRMGCHALFRALHRGDYAAYQQTWHADAEAFRKSEETDKVGSGG